VRVGVEAIWISNGDSRVVLRDRDDIFDYAAFLGLNSEGENFSAPHVVETSRALRDLLNARLRKAKHLAIVIWGPARAAVDEPPAEAFAELEPLTVQVNEVLRHSEFAKIFRQQRNKFRIGCGNLRAPVRGNYLQPGSIHCVKAAL
jgi:hypothetical protein